MDDLQIKVKKAIEMYPESLQQHLALKRVMADVFGNERDKAKAFCLAFGMGIVDVCNNDPQDIKDIYDCLVEDYLVDSAEAKWVVFTWCEVFELIGYEKYLSSNSYPFGNMIESMLGNSTNMIVNHVEKVRLNQEQEKQRKEEERQQKLLEQARIEREFQAYKDGTLNNDVIEMYRSLFVYLRRNRINLDMICIQITSGRSIIISSSTKKFSIYSNCGISQNAIRINETDLILANTTDFEEKKNMCKLLGDIDNCKQVIEGLKFLLDFISKDNFKRCKITNDLCTIAGFKVDMIKRKIYTGNQELITRK